MRSSPTRKPPERAEVMANYSLPLRPPTPPMAMSRPPTPTFTPVATRSSSPEFDNDDDSILDAFEIVTAQPTILDSDVLQDYEVAQDTPRSPLLRTGQFFIVLEAYMSGVFDDPTVVESIIANYPGPRYETVTSLPQALDSWEGHCERREVRAPVHPDSMALLRVPREEINRRKEEELARRLRIASDEAMVEAHRLRGLQRAGAIAPFPIAITVTTTTTTTSSSSGSDDESAVPSPVALADLEPSEPMTTTIASDASDTLSATTTASPARSEPITSNAAHDACDATSATETASPASSEPTTTAYSTRPSSPLPVPMPHVHFAAATPYLLWPFSFATPTAFQCQAHLDHPCPFPGHGPIFMGTVPMFVPQPAGA